MQYCTQCHEYTAHAETDFGIGYVEYGSRGAIHRDKALTCRTCGATYDEEYKLPEVDKIKINFGRTVNLGNYESLRIDVELSATLGAGDDVQHASEDLFFAAKRQVAKYIEQYNDPWKKDVLTADQRRTLDVPF